MSNLPALRLAVLFGAWLLLLLPGPGLAASPLRVIKDLKQPVAAGSRLTYADLLLLIFPAPAAGVEEERQTPPVRNLGDYFKTQPLTAHQGYGGVLAVPIKARDQKLLLLLVSAECEPAEAEGDAEGQHFDLLALFQTAPAPKLLDLLDLGQGVIMGQNNSFWSSNPLLDLTPGTQACMVYQEHFNSSQSYLQIHLLWVRNQRLEELLGVSPFGVKALCETFATRTVFWTEPDWGREFPRVMAKLTVKMEPGPKDEEQCQARQPGFTRSYQGVWRFDPVKQNYQEASGNLDQLYKWYDKYY
jgi:hypothetical protein